MTKTNLNREFEKWLKNPASKGVLDELINKVHYIMKTKGLFLRGMPPKDTMDNEKIFQEELKQECLVFLLEDESMLSTLMGRSGFGLVKKRLYDKLVDLSRREKDIQRDTWRLFRRNILRALGESDRFFKNEQNHRENFFSRTIDARQAAIADDDLKDIAYSPALPLSLTDLNSQKNILKAAEYFWASAAECAGLADISLPVNSFIKWIEAHVALQARVLSGESSDDDDDTPGILETSPTPNAFNDIKKRTLTTWAQTCFNYLEDNEKYLFFYFLCKNLTHDAVSKLMGKKSNMTYQRNKMIDRLQFFLSSLDGLAPDNGRESMDTADLDFFRFQLCADLNTWHAHKEKA
ncbi:hypothetical protein [Desulfobacter sp.]